MRSNRMKNTSPPRRKRSAIKRVKPQRGTLPLLITLSVFVVAMIFFAPKIAQTPAANVSGTEVDEAAVSSGDTNLRITEAMSSNRSAFPDETGAFPDWVEITNTGDSPINIKGYGLSDRADKITFVFPDLTLAAGRTCHRLRFRQHAERSRRDAARQIQTLLCRRQALPLRQRRHRFPGAGRARDGITT